MGVLHVKNLSTYYKTKEGDNEALQGFNLELQAGEMVGLIGESGCGKSTAGFSLMNMIQPPGRIVEGDIVLDGTDLIKLNSEGLRKVLWKEIAMIPQSAMNALNPAYKVGDQILEVIKLHFPGLSKQEGKSKVGDLLNAVGIDSKWYDSYPHKLSGGMKQRVIIAMALACEPKVIVSDESTTGLDVLIEAQILALLKKLKTNLGISIIIVSHDLHMVTSICDRIGIMYAGHLVEIGTTKEIQNDPKHPYTKALFASQVDVNDFDKTVESIDGTVPKLINPERKCRFYSRCLERLASCNTSDAPMLKKVTETHSLACYLEV